MGQDNHVALFLPAQGTRFTYIHIYTVHDTIFRTPFSRITIIIHARTTTGGWDELDTTQNNPTA